MEIFFAPGGEPMSTGLERAEREAPVTALRAAGWNRGAR
jgi:hypothetical protein